MLLDGNLKTSVEAAFREEGMTPAIAQSRIQEMISEITRFIDRLKALKEAFVALGISEAALQAGEVELGVLIPRESIENKLDRLGDEIKEIDEIFKFFSVVATGTREDFEISYISLIEPNTLFPDQRKTALIVSATVTLFQLSKSSSRPQDQIRSNWLRVASQRSICEALKAGIKEKIEKDLEQFRKEIIERYGHHKKAADRNEDSNRLKVAMERGTVRLERRIQRCRCASRASRSTRPAKELKAIRQVLK